MRLAAVCLATALVSLCADYDRARFTRDGDLVRPTNYREWIFLSSGLGMTYGPNAPAAGQALRFDNVFVNPSSYRHFMRSGQWPDGTVFILEVRDSQSKGSINQHGSFQTGIAAVEAHVKDSRRFKSGWAFYDMKMTNASAKVIPSGNSCERCHEEHGLVDTTFVQFYPDLIPVATKFDRLKRAAATQQP